MNKPTIAVIILGAAIIGGAFLFISGGNKTAAAPAADNVKVNEGKQIVEIGVKGGYTPKQSVAKAGIPTILRMKTNGTFDCSSGVTIPSLGIRQTLPSTGETDVEIPAQKSGTSLEGVCVMGMYHFTINFS
jgi:plastocyanin domain-containing protein